MNNIKRFLCLLIFILIYTNLYAADVKISDLPTAGPQSGSEMIPEVQNGVTMRTTVGAILNTSGSTKYEPKNSNIQSHITNTNNPHNTTPTKIGLVDTKCANIDPNSDITNWVILKARMGAITITYIDCLVDVSTSAVLTPQECDGNGGNCVNISSPIVCGVTNTTGTITNSSINANNWIRIVRGTVLGSPTQASICITFTRN
jgi:hypothetical protein